jgi:hypothetical protein
VGLSAGNVPGVIAGIQKSLGGFNEMGEPTADVFKAIGLSVDDLKSMGAAEQIQAISGALAQMPKDEAMNLAAKISKGGAGDLLQIGRSAEDFASAMEKAGEQARILEQNAAQFDQLGDTFRELKQNVAGFALGIAAGIAPALQQLVNLAKQINFTAIGEQIGKAITAIGAAFQQGKIGDLLSLALEAGITKVATFTESLLSDRGLWEGIGNAALGGLAILGRGLMEMFRLSTDLLQAGITKALEEGLAALAASPLGRYLGVSFEARSFSEILSSQRSKSGDLFKDLFGDNFLNEALGLVTGGASGIGSALARARAASTTGVAGDQLTALLKELGLSGEVGSASANRTSKFQSVANMFAVNSDKANVDSLGRIGGFFGTNIQSDYSRRAAIAAEKQVQAIQGVQKRLEQGLIIAGGLEKIFTAR